MLSRSGVHFQGFDPVDMPLLVQLLGQLFANPGEDQTAMYGLAVQRKQAGVGSKEETNTAPHYTTWLDEYCQCGLGFESNILILRLQYHHPSVTHPLPALSFHVSIYQNMTGLEHWPVQHHIHHKNDT